MSNVHDMADGPIRRLIRRYFRTQPIKPVDIKEHKPFVLVPIYPDDVTRMLESCVTIGTKTNDVIESILNDGDYYGGCDQNGNECSNPKCRVCRGSEIRSMLRQSLHNDMDQEIYQLFLKKGRGI